MAVTFTMTWAGGLATQTTGGFTITDDRGVVRPWNYDVKQINNIPDPTARAVADELSNQAGAATGTVTVTIS